MTTRHSLFTRGLSLLLAFCMLLSNMGGLTLRAEAADKSLYDVLATKLGSNSGLMKALTNAQAVLPDAAALLNEAVDYPAYLDEINGTLVNGLLTLESTDGWIPVSYSVDGESYTAYNEPVFLEEIPNGMVLVTYEKETSAAAQAEALYGYMRAVGQEAVSHAALLDSVSDSDALTALDFLDVNFIGGMIDTVDELTAEEMETSEDELEDIKTEWKAIIAQLLDRVLDSGDYEDYLLIYSMLDQYASEGLPFYYQDSVSINYELEAMADILDEILSYGESVVDALIDKMGYSQNVKAYHLAEMADRMHDAADGLYISFALETEDVAALEALFGAGIPVANLSYTAISATVSADYVIENKIVEETEPTTAPTEPEVTEPEVTEPEVTEPEVTEPVETEPTTAPTEPELGSEENPIVLEFVWDNDVMAHTLGYSVPAGETVYFQGYGLGGLNVVAMLSAGPNMLDGTVVMNGAEMPAVAAGTFNAVATGNPRMPTTFAVTNNSETDGKIFFNVNHILGSQMNPATLTIGTNEAVIAADSQGYYYTWTAAEDARLTVTMPEGNWFYVINNLTSGIYGDGQWSDSDPVVNPAEVKVAAGDEIQIIVNTYDPGSWNTPAGTITFTAALGSACDHEYFYECDKYCMHCGELTNEEAAHSIKHVDPIEVTCYENGQVEYWYCEFCGSAWLDAECTMVTNLKSVVIPASHTNVKHVEAVAPACHYNGNSEYWVCYDCETWFADEALTQITNSKNVVVPAVGGEVVHFEAVEPACHYEGNVEYWFCPECENYWTDEALTKLSNSKRVIVPATGSDLLVAVEAVEPGCHDNGCVAHWICYECEQVWLDEALTQLTNSKNIVVPAVGGDVTHVEAVAATCFENGNVEYWACEKCEKVWTDEALTQLTNIKNVVVPMAHKELTHVEAKEANCYEDGNIEYWTCEACGYAWLDAEGVQSTNLKAVVLPAACQNVKHVRALKPTCTTEGNVKYWYCADCERFWTDEARTQLTNSKSVILPAACQNVKHVEAVEATCFENGNIEYWYCEDCLTFWQDENLMQITNSKNVVIPMGHQELTHVPAKAATCFENGNVEYWYCEACGYAWLDAEGTMNTNLKAVVLPASHGELEHHDAVRARCGKDGSVEYWYCPNCDKNYADEACTEVLENVVIPGTHMPSGIINFIIKLFTRSAISDGEVCAEFDCAYCDAKNVIVKAEIVEETVKKETCTEDGQIDKVPTVVLNGETFTAKDTGDKEITLEDGSVVKTEVKKDEAVEIESVVVPAKTHDFEEIAAVEAKCHEDGNVKYWHCTDPECDEYFITEAKDTPVAKEATVVPAKGAEVIHVEGDTCTTEHWYCVECNKTWLDEALTELATEEDVLVNHDLEWVKESCYNVEYWHCVKCEGYWIDNMSMPTNSKRVVKYPEDHALVHVDAVAKTCYEEGNVEYWYCEECENVWTNAELTERSNFKSVITPASHGEIVHKEAKAATCFENGNIEYWYCADCGQAWLDADCTLNTNLKAVILPMAHAPLTHVEAKAATCFEDGNIEYWTCEACGYAWLDAEGTLNTNLKAVVLPMAHKELTHVEAVEATCFENGNIEYWTCEACGYAWLDAEGTQNTNLKAVVLPMAHKELTHVPAVEATCFETGNIEYWTCEACGYAWLDAEGTLNTNLKAVVTPLAEPETVNVEVQFNAAQNEASAEVKLGRGIWILQLPIDPEMELYINGVKTEFTVSGGRAKRPGQMVTVEIVNKDHEEKIYHLEAKYPVGHRMNPMVVDTATIIPNSITVEAGTQGYYIVITNATKGTYYLNMVNGMGSIGNKTTSVYSDFIYAGESGFACTAKDNKETIEICVNTFDPESPWSAPAGKIEFSVDFMNPAQVNFIAVVGTKETNIMPFSKITFPIGYKLTEADLAEYVASYEAWINKQTNPDALFFNVDNLYAYAGYTVVEGNGSNANKLNVILTDAALVDGVKYGVDAEGLISLKNLGYTTEGMYQVKVNDTVYDLQSIEETVKLNIGEENTVEILKKVTALEWLAEQLNSANAGTYVADGEAQTLVANITAGDFVAFVEGLYNASFNGKPYTSVKLGDETFMESGALKINMNALVQAILADELFTNESIIALGNNGKGALVHTTLTTALFENVPFTINLTAAPAQMATAAEALEAAKSHFWFNGSDEGLQVFVRVPEKAYEALTGYEMITGMDKASVEQIANAAAQTYVEYMIGMLQDESITTATYTNTLQMLGVNKNLNGYASAYEFVQNIVTDSQFFYNPGEEISTVNVAVQNAELLALLGMDSFDDIQLGADKLILDKDITAYTIVNIVNEVPHFNAIIVDPTLVVNKDFGVEDIKAKDLGAIVNDNTSLVQKAQAINMTTDLAADLGSVYGPAMIMLVDTVNGDLTFNHTTILDLNGKVINGNIVANAPVVIMDSSINTISGAEVNGSVSGDVTILAGKFRDNVEAFLRDGYFQDSNNNVRTALFTIAENKLLVDSAIYTDNVDGYLPAAHYMAAEIALDFALNFITGASLNVNGKYNASNTIYNITVDDLVGMLGRKSAGEIVDAALACIDAPALSDFVNKILEDLVNVDAVAASVKTGEILSTYTFYTTPWSAEIEHILPADYLTVNVAPAGDAKEISLGLAIMANTDREISIPKTDRTFTAQEILDELAEVVVTVDDDTVDGTVIEIMMNQPERQGKTLVVGGNLQKAIVNLDFSGSENYNRLLGAALAYFYEDLTEDLVKNGCIVRLNETLASITVGEFFGTLNKVVQNKEISFEEIAAKVGLDLTADQLADLNKAYAKFQNGVAKIINKFDLDESEATPLSDLMDNEGNLVFDGTIGYHEADAYYKNYGVKAELYDSAAKLIIKLAQGEHTIVHVEAKEATCMEEGNIEHWYCEICGYAWLDADLTRNTNLKAVILPIDENAHVPGEAVEEETVNGYPCQHDEVVYCTLCGEEISRKSVGGLWGDANCDGEVDNIDAMLIARYDVGLTAANKIHLEACDVNGDGVVDNIDAMLVARYDVGFTSKYPIGREMNG